ncbi:DUF6602 domain-containing protein [Peribacillus loiseleuriae]|uniref:DUF6602 domain-containing protein n=1 Tax=Peribacillus loiseleuriae TaxID=1679170 RepID=UPI00380F85B6
MKEFLDVLKLEASEIQNRFLRSSIEGKGTSQEVSDFREHAVQDFVRRYYPFPYQISKGGIYDSYGNRSDSIDCLILHPNHPHTINSHGKHSLIVADGVDAAIEVKPSLASKKELERALIQGISVKKLRRRIDTLLLENRQHVLNLSKQIPYFIFSLEAKKDVKGTINEIKTFYAENQTAVIDQLDVVVILNKGLIVNYKYADLYPWKSNFTNEQKAGWLFEEWGENSLAGFLYNLDRSFGASANITESYLKYYLLSQLYNSIPV